MPHNRSGRVDHTIIHGRHRDQLIRCANKSIDPTFNQCFIRGKWYEIPDLLQGALGHDIGEIDGVVAIIIQNRFGLLLAIGITHRLKIPGDCIIVRMNGHIHARVAMPIGPGANAHAFKKFIR